MIHYLLSCRSTITNELHIDNVFKRYIHVSKKLLKQFADKCKTTKEHDHNDRISVWISSLKNKRKEKSHVAKTENLLLRPSNCAAHECIFTIHLIIDQFFSKLYFTRLEKKFPTVSPQLPPEHIWTNFICLCFNSIRFLKMWLLKFVEVA